MDHIKLALIIGGRSAEHTIALRSSQSIINNLDKTKYQLHVIYVDRKGNWFSVTDDPYKLNIEQLEQKFLNDPEDCFQESTPSQALQNIHVAFPVIHGTYGEDGVVQGVLRARDIPFVGCDILGSAAGMDKEVSKRVVRDAGIQIADFVTLYANNPGSISFSAIEEKLGLPVFVKPANAGSSVGVHKVTNESDYDRAIVDAFQYDKKLIIEEAVVGQEIECAILGNEEPKASVIGEIVPTDEFYSYDAKYIDEDGAKLLIPANIPDDAAKMVQEQAISAFKALGCEGLSRVDFFLKPEGSLIFNEINTFPGFTSISMYPSLWQASGIGYSELLDQLIELGLQRFERDQKLTVDFK